MSTKYIQQFQDGGNHAIGGVWADDGVAFFAFQHGRNGEDRQGQPAIDKPSRLRVVKKDHKIPLPFARKKPTL
ncbi:MAG TPA: hypothetical protein VEK33_22790 [Terriglobales bacterium]|nr:hypothetical protein [Terriglobales bacterium]